MFSLLFRNVLTKQFHTWIVQQSFFVSLTSMILQQSEQYNSKDRGLHELPSTQVLAVKSVT